MEGIKIVNQFEEGNKVYIVAESIIDGCECPRCGIVSKTKHSKYTRKLFSGSLNGVSKEITLIVKKFKCKVKECSQKIFTERLSFAPTYSRFCNSIIELIKVLALTISAEKVSIILSKVGIAISHDSVIRLLKTLPKDTVKVDNSTINIGIDDFAFKKRKNYGTLICDMDKRVILDILPSRTKEDVSHWLKSYPHIQLVSRDGSITYGAAISEALPDATQVSDKFHLIKNLLDSVSKYIRRKYPKALILNNNEENVAKHLEPNETEKNKLREERIDAKWQLMKDIKEKHNSGISIRELAREYSMSRVTIRKYLVSESPIYWSEGSKRGSKLDKFKELIVRLLDEGNTHEGIFIILKEIGYDGSRQYLSAYMSRNNIKRNPNDKSQSLKNKENLRTISVSSVIKMICKNSTNLKDKEIKMLEDIKVKFPELLDLRKLIEEFKSLFKPDYQSIDTWIEKARDFNISEVNSFILGIERDIDSVKNSMNIEYNNGLLEGMVNKVKTIKRTSYGRCNFDLLRLKVLNFQEIYG